MTQEPRLGRGLAALFGDQGPRDPAAQSGPTPIDHLEPNPFQPRTAIAEDDLADLAASIRAQGMLQPILVRRHPERSGRYQIVAGERRWRAARLAGLTSVPTTIRDLTDTEAAAAALVENLQRQDLNAIEEAAGYRRLVDAFGLTQERIATAIGKSRSHIANTLRLLSLPPSVIRLVGDGVLTAGHARAALACADPAAAASVMVAKGLNVRQAEALASGPEQPFEPSRRKVPAAADPDIAATEARLADVLGLAVSISFNGKGGTISLRYRSLDQLDHIIERLDR